MVQKTCPLKIETARDLRIKERLSLSEISTRVGIPKGTLSPFLSDIPLSKEEIRKRNISALEKGRDTRSRFSHSSVSNINPIYDESHYLSLTTQQKGAIAESAVRARLTSLGYVTLVPDVQNMRYDMVAHDISSNTFIRIQIKTARFPSQGMPIINLISNNNGARRQYHIDDFDAVIAYNFETNRFFVIACADISHKFQGRAQKNNTLTLKAHQEDAWHVLNASVARRDKATAF